MTRAACLLLTTLTLAPACSGAPTSMSDSPPVFEVEPGQVVTSAAGRLLVSVWTAPSPPRKGVNAARLRVVDVRGLAVAADVTATAWMPAHGHGTSVNPSVTDAGEGVYELDHVVFFMDGRWELRGEATDASGVPESFVATFDVL